MRSGEIIGWVGKHRIYRKCNEWGNCVSEGDFNYNNLSTIYIHCIGLCTFDINERKVRRTTKVSAKESKDEIKYLVAV